MVENQPVSSFPPASSVSCLPLPGLSIEPPSSATIQKQPFLEDAPISRNLKALLRRWLTVDENESSGEEDDGDRWHSQFELDPETFPLFKNKVMAILREPAAFGAPAQVRHTLFRHARLPCGSDRPRWRRGAGWRIGSRLAVAQLARAGTRPRVESEEQRRRCVCDASRRGSGIEPSHRPFFVSEVLPLVLQRHRNVRGLLLTSGTPLVEADLLGAPKVQVADLESPRALAGASALLLPPDMDSVPEQLIAEARRQDVPVVGLGPGSGELLDFEADHEASEAWEFADVCCRLMEGP